MRPITIIHASADAMLVHEDLAPLLPPLGFDQLAARAQPTVVVISSTGLADERVVSALRSKEPKIGLRVDEASRATMKEFPHLTVIDASDLHGGSAAVRMRVGRQLGHLLARNESGAAAADAERRIGWTESVFSEFLADACAMRDFDRVRQLVEILEVHLSGRKSPYPDDCSRNDLGQLRQKRQFDLLCRAGHAVVDRGGRDFKTLRLYAQGLIELKRFDRALALLSDIVERAPAGHFEWLEAKGLIGRLHKQRYIDAVKADGAEEQLRRSIDTYQPVFEKYRAEALWHGINASSLLLRARRDGFKWADERRARQLASEIRAILDERKSQGALKDVWDFATRVEAMVNVGDFEHAGPALDEYLSHPDMDAFEVSSTHRQFDEVLQLGSHPLGQPLVDALWRAVVRFRGGGIDIREGKRGMLVRVTTPDWEPIGIPGLSVVTRSGTILSVIGPKSAFEALLKDPRVITIEESRPGGGYECRRSMPFIGVQAKYNLAANPFEERGENAIVAVIDEGIDLLHEAFRDDAGKSRVVAIWDQRDKGNPPAPFDFGREHDEAQIAGYIDKPETIPPLLRTDPHGHGTHVTSIAAGRRTAHFAGGVAPEARIVLVLTEPTDDIGYSVAHKAALDYVATIARKRAASLKREVPVVINLSQGTHAGAHDGKSGLETAFDRFSETGTKPGYVIVKSAGNERDKNTHADIPIAQGKTQPVEWIHRDRRTKDERLEFWWNGFDSLSFRLGSPKANDWSDWVSRGNPEVKGTLAGGRFTMKHTPRHPDNGHGLLRIDVTDMTSLGINQPWTVEIHGDSVRSGQHVHAWIERTNAEIPSSFLQFMWHEVTLTVPATAMSVIAVGAVQIGQPGHAPQVSRFSSFGKTRDDRPKPEVSAPGVGIEAAKAGTADGCVVMDGTSMAAPHVTGAIALALSRRVATDRPLLTASQITTELAATTQGKQALYTHGFGYGVLDVAAFLEGCELL